MTKKYLFFILIFSFFLGFYACSDDNESNNDGDYTPVPTSPVTVDLTQVPYEKLSDYHFFEGDLKNQKPYSGVLAYTPASTLFTDYALKKRFVWMPKNTKGSYNGDGNILELPVGAVLIKTFYYDNVQPNNTTQIIETRLMIRKEDGWIFANYVWNDEQNEAFFDLDGSDIPISWLDENNTLKSANYRIPSEVQCITCHKHEEEVDHILITTHTPIGIKPQNLNFNYDYSGENKNQLSKWIEDGYLENNFSLPSTENTVVDYHDLSQPLDLRARSYVDINCAHCHRDGGHCNYRPMRYAFNETYNNNRNMGVCVDTQDMQDFPPALSKIVTPGNIERSMMYYRLNTEDESYRMPLHGRTIIHTEGVELIRDWINSLSSCP